MRNEINKRIKLDTVLSWFVLTQGTSPRPRWSERCDWFRVEEQIRNVFCLWLYSAVWQTRGQCGDLRSELIWCTSLILLRIWVIWLMSQTCKHTSAAGMSPKLRDRCWSRGRFSEKEFKNSQNDRIFEKCQQHSSSQQFTKGKKQIKDPKIYIKYYIWDAAEPTNLTWCFLLSTSKHSKHKPLCSIGHLLNMNEFYCRSAVSSITAAPNPGYDDHKYVFWTLYSVFVDTDVAL